MKHNFLCFSLLLCLLFPILLTQPPAVITENNVLILTFSEDQFQGFVYYIPPKTSPQLTISFFPQSMESDPGNMILIFSKIEEITNNPESKKHCYISRVSSCPYIIPENMTELFFTLHCAIGMCDYRIRLSHFSEIHLLENLSEYFIFEKESKIFNFSVPSQKDFSRLVFKVQTHLIPNENITYLFSQEVEVKLNSGDPIKTMIGDNQIFVFNNTDNTLCHSCNISANIKTQKGAILELEVFLYQDQTLNLELNHTYIDYLTLKQDNEYVVTLDEELVNNENFVLLISINSLSGSHKKLSVNVDYPVKSSGFPQWNSSTLTSFYQEQNIVIKKSDLISLQLKGSKYYLSVTGDSHGLYSLHLTAQKDKVLPLTLGVKQSGLIKNEELIYYKIQIWRNTEVNLGLMLSATVMTGNIRIFGKNCGQYDNCSLISSDDIKNNKEIDFKTKDETLSSFKFYPDCIFYFCYYLLAVQGHSSSSLLSKYYILLKKQSRFTTLIESQSYETQINKMEIQKFNLFLDNAYSEIETIIFFINNELDYFVSRNASCFDFYENLCDIRSGNLYNPVIYDKSEGKQMFGEYFLFVFGSKSSELIIFPEVRRLGHSEVYIKLLEGKMMSYFLTLAKQISYFEFYIDSSQPTQVEVNVQSNEPNGLKVYLSRGTGKPGPENYFMSSSSNFLSFEHNEQASQGLYRIAVEAKVFKKNRTNPISLALLYSTEGTIHHLESNQPYYDTLGSESTKKFLLFLDTNNEIIYINRHILSPEGYNLQMTLSLSKDEEEIDKIPGFNPEAPSIKLTNDIIKSFCALKHVEMYGKCPVYIKIQNLFHEEVFYVITVRTKEDAIQLKQGKEQSARLHEGEESLNLYFIPTSNELPIDIYFHSLKFKFDTYITIYHNKESNGFNSWPFPNENKTDNYYNISNKHRVSTMLKPLSLLECFPKCVVLFNIKLKDFKPTVIEEDILQMMVSGGFTELNENLLMQFNSEQSISKFFKFDIKELTKTNASILMDLTNLAGLSELYVSLNDEDMNEVYPTKDSFDYYSADGHLVLTMDSLLSKKNNSILRDLYIAVHCLNLRCESAFTVRTTYKMIQQISHGRPFDFMTYADQLIIFEYYHYSDTGFEFKVNKEKGLGQMQVIPCFDKRLEDCLLTHTKETSMRSFSSSSIKFKKKETESYCINCIYLVLIRPNNTILSGTFNVILDREFLMLSEGRKFYDSLEELEENLYSCKAPATEELQITVNIYHNEPELYVTRTLGYSRNKYDYKAFKNKEPVISVTVPPILDRNRQVHDEIYIIVYSKAPSNYSITCRSTSAYTILHAGLIEFGEIKPQHNYKYLFNSNELNIHEHIPKFIIGSLSPGGNPLKAILQFKPTKSDFWGNLTSSEFQETSLNSSNLIISYNSETIILTNQSGIFEINIFNPENKIIKYSVALQTGEINMMPYDTMIEVPILQNEWIYYETFIPNKGLFVLDLVECVGSMEVFTAREHEKLIAHDFDYEFKVFQGQSNLRIFKVRKGTLYLAIKLLGNVTETIDGALGQLNTHFYERYEEIPQNRLTIPNEGILDYFYHFDERKILVTFKSLFCISECDEKFLGAMKVNYTLLASQNLKMLDQHGKCGLLSYKNSSFDISEFKKANLLNVDISNKSFPLGIAFPAEDSNTTYYVSLVARIESYPDSFTPVSMFYKQLELKKSEVKIKKVIAYGLTILLIMVVLILGMCVCYYYGGYKRLVNKLRYEIKDIENPEANVTSLNASIEMKNTRYEGLMMLDDKLA